MLEELGLVHVVSRITEDGVGSGDLSLPVVKVLIAVLDIVAELNIQGCGPVWWQEFLSYLLDKAGEGQGRELSTFGALPDYDTCVLEAVYNFSDLVGVVNLLRVEVRLACVLPGEEHLGCDFSPSDSWRVFCVFMYDGGKKR